MYPTGNQVLKCYQNRDFDGLLKYKLSDPINNNGDTIIHVMAKNMDIDAFKTIMNKNINALNYATMNSQNNNGMTPLHVALDEHNLRDINDTDLLNLMIFD